MKMKSLSQWIPAFTIAAAVAALPMTAHAQDNQQSDQANKQESREGEESKNKQQNEQKEGESPKDAKRAMKLQVFELKHCDPQQLNQIVMMISRASIEHQSGNAHAAQPMVNTAGYRGTANNPNQFFTAVQPEEKTLFVRAPEEQIKLVEELVNAYDVEAQQIQEQEFHGIYLIPVKREQAHRVHATLSQLHLHGEALQLGEMNLIAIRRNDMSEEEVDQAKQIVQKLTRSKKDAKNAKSGEGEQKGQNKDQKNAQNEDQNNNQNNEEK